MQNLIYGVPVALAIAGLFSEHTPLWFDWPFLGFAVCIALASQIIEKDHWRESWCTWLETSQPGSLYRRIMEPLLAWVESKLTPTVRSENTTWLDLHAKDEESAQRSGTFAFGWMLLNFSCLVATVYPLVLLILQWATFGVGRLGDTILLTKWENFLNPFAALTAIYMLFPLAVTLNNENHRKYFFKVFSISFSLISILIIASSGETLDGYEVGVTGAFLMLFVFRNNYIGSVSIPSATALACAYILAGESKFYQGLSMAAPVFAALTMYYLLSYAIQSGRAFLGFFASFSLAVCALLLTSIFSGSSEWDDQRKNIFLFLGFFPLINGLFDFLSYGLTRGLARGGLARGGAAPFIAGLLDILLAAYLFTCLGAALISAVALMNWLSGTTLFDLAPLFADLRTAPLPGQSWWDSPSADYIWLYAMLFSTLLPTLAHAGLSCLSLARWLPFGLRCRIAGCLRRHDDSLSQATLANVGLGLVMLLSFALPIAALVGLWMGLSALLPLAGQTYLQIFELVAQWLGQIPEIGPGYIDSTWERGIEV